MKTKKFRIGKTFRTSYSLIAQLNRHIDNINIEIECHKKHKDLIEAESKEELVAKLKSQLHEFEINGFDIDYRG